MERFATISHGLLESYDRLSERAERVEGELAVANAELARRVAELDAILEALPTGVVVRDCLGAVTRVNAAALEIAGTPAGGDTAQLTRLFAGLPQDAAEPVRVELERPDGAVRALRTRTAAIQVRQGDGAGSVQILDDQTELEQLGRRAATSEKMAAVGTLAAGIAHEIRNPLNAIKGFAALLGRGVADNEKHARWAELAVSGCEEAEAIVAGLLSYAEPSQLELETVDASELVADALARCTVPADASVETFVDAPPFAGDRIKLRQALRNLIDNALSVQTTSARVRVTARVEAGELALRVADAGAGVEPSLRDRVLEPFYTTRAEGTGLGLALTHTVAQLHGGRLEIEDACAEYGGAEFVLRFPLRVSHETR
ncbi:Sensor protein ZraS [Planctomycetes bacterium Pla86]|uniref:histidine kinase n=2 Tax=Engelhardtia mirabilis TaxID=2528011 RepID=A0A518BSS3_9BACT|nr:Sensor protein ZraS [Planctomycetes bacterium Pla133]QDV04346.1 Sensor protein ZraS [Planctomycetes bacterium Pla86]